MLYTKPECASTILPNLQYLKTDMPITTLRSVCAPHMLYLTYATDETPDAILPNIESAFPNLMTLVLYVSIYRLPTYIDIKSGMHIHPFNIYVYQYDASIFQKSTTCYMSDM